MNGSSGVLLAEPPGMLRIVFSASAVVLAVGCYGEPDPQVCPGGKCDDPKSGGISLVQCTVMDPGGQEGLQTAYAFDSGGFFTGDVEASTVAIEERGDAGQGGHVMRLGREIIGEDGDDAVTELEPAEEVFAETDQIRWSATDGASGDEYELRVFTENSVGMILRKESGDDRFLRTALLDCNPNNLPPSTMEAGAAPEEVVSVLECRDAEEDDEGVCRTSDGRFAEARCCESAPLDRRCTVVSYFDFVLDSAMGTPYEYMREGERESFEEHEDVGVRASSFSKLDSGLLADLGGLSVGLHSELDRIERLDEDPAEDVNPNTGFLRWRLVREGGRAHEMRVFTGNGAGVMLVDGDDDGEAERPYAFIECRDDYEEPGRLEL